MYNVGYERKIQMEPFCGSDRNRKHVVKLDFEAVVKPTLSEILEGDGKEGILSV